MQLKEFKKAFQEKSSLISDVFLEQKKILAENSQCSINTDFKIYYDSNKEYDIQYLKDTYAYFEILKEQRKDIPYNIHELSFYEYSRVNHENCVLTDFLQHNSVEALEKKILRHWYYLFDCRNRSSSRKPLYFYNKIFLNPSYEQYKRHYVTYLILDHIYNAKYAIGVIKEDLSLYEQAIIEKIKPFKNLECLQIDFSFGNWLFNSKTVYNHLNKLFEKEPHIKVGFEKIARNFQFDEI